MRHREFLEALGHLLLAYASLDAALVGAAQPSMAPLLGMDPLTRAAGEEFAHPVVQWFRRGSTLRGVCVDDGTLVFDVPPGGCGAVLFLPGLRVDHDARLPDDWRRRARRVAEVDRGILTLDEDAGS